MKRIMVAVVFGLLAMSSVAEACCGKRIGCGGGGLGHHRQRSCSACGGHKGLFHHCKQQTMTCQPAVEYQPTFSYQQPVVYQQQPQSAVYQTVAPPTVTTATPQVPSKLPPIAIVPPQPPVTPPQPPGKATPQR
jgi:hypothetical protein